MYVLGVLCGFLFFHLYNIYLFGKKVQMSGHIETAQTLKSRKYMYVSEDVGSRFILQVLSTISVCLV